MHAWIENAWGGWITEYIIKLLRVLHLPLQFSIYFQIYCTITKISHISMLS